MNTILKIYKRDIRNIVKNPALIITMIALLFVPALYAWINIIAGWDPYANTKGLLVAVVNNDKGASFRNIKLSIGNEVVNKLKNNENIGWTFVEQSEAETGVKYGKYYASITIPENFSSNLLSLVTSAEPKKAQLIYSVNEKISAVAPKITRSGVTSLESEITSSFTQEVSNTVFSYLNAYGLELQAASPGIKKLADFIIDVDNNIPQVGESINNAYDLVNNMHNYIQIIQGNIPTVTDTLNRASGIVKSSNDFLGKANNTLKSIPAYINTDLAVVKDNVDTIVTNLNSINSSISAGISGQQEALRSVSNKLSSTISSLDNTIGMLQSINSVLNSSIVSDFINSLQDIRNNLNQNNLNINNFIDTLDRGGQVSSDAISSVIQSINTASQRINNAIDNFNNNVSQSIDTFINNSTGITNNSLKLLQDAQNNMPLISNLLKNVDTATVLGGSQIKNIRDRFPSIQQSIHNTAEKIRRLNDDEKFNELLKLMQKNAKVTSDFLANPITVVQNRVFPIPNYGSAMTPFYTTLAIWVGAFTLLSMLSLKVKPLENTKSINAREEFFGRYLTITTITIAQALIVSLGNVLVLKTYAVSPIVFVMFSIYVSIVFTMIVYTLVSVFGNVGKALALVAMVLQVSASGGTFPIQLTPRFFQNINPILPFTYAIGGMREAQGGIIWSILYRHIVILAIYFVLSIVIAIFLKEKINKKSEKFVNRIKESGLVGE